MTTTTSDDIVPVSKVPSAQQLSFMNTLHFDVTIKIFSFLSQQDCLTSMAVCRDWYHAIPQYTQKIWGELRFKEGDMRADHYRRQQCLGSHVKRVVLQCISSVTLMQRLVDWNCTKIESLGLVQCATEEQSEFVDLLRQLGSCLTHLELKCHESGIAVLSVFNACPNLTHFSYTTTGDVQYIEDEMAQQLINISLNYPCTKITHLYLSDRGMVTKKQLEWILKRCPVLRHLVIPPSASDSFDQSSVVDLDSLFTWCPKLTFLSIAFSESKEIEYPEGSTGLRYLDATDDYDVDKLARCLKRYQGTLEHLSITRYTFHHFDWSPVFQSLCMPSLRFLTARLINFSTASLIVMLNRCPALKVLDLCVPHAMVISSSGFHPLRTMEYLVELHLENLLIDGFCMPTVFGRFPALEKLVLCDLKLFNEIPTHFEGPAHLKALELDDVEFMSNGNGASNEDALSAAFFQRFTRNSNLEVVYAMGIKPDLGLEALKALAMIPTVKKLDIDLGSTLSSGDLLEFIRLLRETRIEDLSLQQVCNISLDVLDALATLSLLKTVYAGWTGDNEYMYIDKEGLRRMLSTSQSLISIKFYNTVIADSDKYLRLHEVNALIEETYWKGAKNSISGRWKVLYFGEYEDPMVLEEIRIERVNF